MYRLKTVALIGAAMLALAGCASASDSSNGSAIAAPSGGTEKECTPGPVPEGTANPYGDSKIDPPAAGEPILVASTKDGKDTTFTLSELEALGTRTLNISEPFVKACQTFTAVPLKAILEKSGISVSAGTLDTIALNDYTYPGVIADMVASDALVATRLSGAEIPINRGGPVRLVFADGTPMSTNLDAWNWSLGIIKEK